MRAEPHCLRHGTAQLVMELGWCCSGWSGSLAKWPHPSCTPCGPYRSCICCSLRMGALHRSGYLQPFPASNTSVVTALWDLTEPIPSELPFALLTQSLMLGLGRRVNQKTNVRFDTPAFRRCLLWGTANKKGRCMRIMSQIESSGRRTACIRCAHLW